MFYVILFLSILRIVSALITEADCLGFYLLFKFLLNLLKGQFTQKSRTHICPPTCHAFYPSRSNDILQITASLGDSLTKASPTHLLNLLASLTPEKSITQCLAPNQRISALLTYCGVAKWWEKWLAGWNLTTSKLIQVEVTESFTSAWLKHDILPLLIEVGFVWAVVFTIYPRP